MKACLLMGCGSRRDRLLSPPTVENYWGSLTTLDIEPSHKPDVIWDLNRRPLPFEDNSFDEIHAYEVLEHLGEQGNAPLFFEEFTEYHRILRPGGHLCATTPRWDGTWAWGDPSHRRVINSGTLVFLSQEEYAKQVGKTPMSDFRSIYHADFRIVGTTDSTTETFGFILQAVKV